FSSRRRHTRSLRDWSSDVCSSDLRIPAAAGIRQHHAAHLLAAHAGQAVVPGELLVDVGVIGVDELGHGTVLEDDLSEEQRELLRSEERRVGKECRSRWLTYDGEEQ